MRTHAKSLGDATEQTHEDCRGLDQKDGEQDVLRYVTARQTQRGIDGVE